MVKINRILVKFHVILLKIHRKNVVNLVQDLVILGQDLVDLDQASWSRYKILDMVIKILVKIHIILLYEFII